MAQKSEMVRCVTLWIFQLTGKWMIGHLVLSLFPLACTQSRISEFPISLLLDGMSPSVQSHVNTSVSLLREEEPIAPLSVSALLSGISPTSTFCQAIKTGIVGMINDHDVDGAASLPGFSSHFKIPLVTTGTAEMTSGKESTFTLFMRPTIARALCKQRFHELLQVLWDDTESSNDIILRMLPVSNPEHAHRILNLTYNRQTGATLHVILDMDIDEMEKFLVLQAETIGRRAKFEFLSANMASHKLKKSQKLAEFFQREAFQLTGFSLVNHRAPNVQLFLSKLNDKLGIHLNSLSIETALVADSLKLFAVALASIMKYDKFYFHQQRRNGKMRYTGADRLSCVFNTPNSSTTWTKGPEILDYLKHTKFHGLTGLVAFEADGQRSNFTLQILRVTRRGFREIGQWDSQRSNITIYPTKPHAGNISTAECPNDPCIVTSILTSPYLIDKNDGSIGNDRYEGYCADLAKVISKKLQRDFIIVPVRDSKYGSQSLNGTWDGMVGELITGEADIAIAPLTITSLRERVIDFSKPFMELGISIMIKKTSKQNPGFFSFMYPLSTNIWLCVIFAYVSVSVVLFLVSVVSDNKNTVKVFDSERDNFTISDSLWFALGAFMQQGTDGEPRSISSRIVGSVWWFFTLIIISSYTANLAAFLTVARMQTPINSAEDLAKQTEIKYGTVRGGSTEEFFQTTEIGTYKQMATFMSQEPSVFVNSNEEGIARVRRSEGKYAFLLESPANEYTNQQKPCDSVRIGSNLDSKGYGIGTPRGSNMSHAINLAVLMLREEGKLEELWKKWWLLKGQCNDDTSQNTDMNSSLKFNKLAGIFYILLSGLLLGFLVTVFENIYAQTGMGKKLSKLLKICKRKEDECGSRNNERRQIRQMQGSVNEPEFPEMISMDFDDTGLDPLRFRSIAL